MQVAEVAGADSFADGFDRVVEVVDARVLQASLLALDNALHAEDAVARFLVVGAVVQRHLPSQVVAIEACIKRVKQASKQAT